MTERENEAAHEYAGGEITSRRGVVNRWLVIVYAGLTLWAI